MPIIHKLRGLYAITDELLTPYQNGLIFKLVEEALKGGAKVIQLRDKHSSLQELLPIAKKLKELCHTYNALLIINDRIDLAIKVEADGLHIGIEDASLREARRKLPNKIIGVSCYGDLERALLAQSEAANYVAFGSFFTSPTKPTAKTISKEVLIEAKKIIKIPICAIGGITLSNAKELAFLGVDMLAVISGLWNSRDIYATAKAFSSLFDKAEANNL